MNRSSRLALTKSTLTAIPIYTAISLCLLPWAISALNKLMKAFVWKGTNVVKGGHCLVAWTQVQRPMELEGLGLLDLRCMGAAQRMRWL